MKVLLKEVLWLLIVLVVIPVGIGIAVVLVVLVLIYWVKSMVWLSEWESGLWYVKWMLVVADIAWPFVLLIYITIRKENGGAC